MEKIMTRLGFAGLPQMLTAVNAIIKQGGTLVFNNKGFLCYQVGEKNIIVHFGLGYEGTRDYWREKLNQLSHTFGLPVFVTTSKQSMLKLFDLDMVATVTGNKVFYIGEA